MFVVVEVVLVLVEGYWNVNAHVTAGAVLPLCDMISICSVVSGANN